MEIKFHRQLHLITDIKNRRWRNKVHKKEKERGGERERGRKTVRETGIRCTKERKRDRGKG